MSYISLRRTPLHLQDGIRVVLYVPTVLPKEKLASVQYRALESHVHTLSNVVDTRD